MIQQDIEHLDTPKFELRPYQQKIINDVRKSIASGHRRIILQLHVGAGKTVVASEIINKAIEKRNRSLFIAPRRQLVYQTVETLKAFDINAGFIMAGENRFTQPLAQVGSFDTITARVGSGRMALPDASLVLADECHATFSKKRLEILKQYPLVIGITATPALANGKGMGEFYTDIVQGPTMKEMVDMGYLVPMRYFGGDAPDVANIKFNSDGDYRESQLAEASDKPELIGSIYKNYKRIAGERTTLIFAVNRKHAQHIHDEFLSHGVSSEYIDGNTPTEERELIKQRVMTGKSKVVINIGVMAFGTDWPIISCVIIARVTRNISAWIQMIGRGSRLFPGKEDCLVIYHGHNFEDLGRIDDDIEWSLDDKSTVRERREKKKKESKEPKEITCGDCGTIFKSRKTCPTCGYEMVKKGEPIPFYEAELKELTKPKPIEKSQFYSELLGYSRRHGKSDSYALAIFRSRFNEWPYNKRSIKPSEPSPETLGYIKHNQIKWAKRNAA